MSAKLFPSGAFRGECVVFSNFQRLPACLGLWPLPPPVICVCVYERKREKLICWIDKGSWPTFSFGERVGMKSSQEVLSPGRYASLSKPAQIWLRRFSCFLLPHKGMEADFNEPWRFKRLSHVLFLTPCSFILFDSKQGNWAASFLLPCCFGLNRKERNEAGNIDCL